MSKIYIYLNTAEVGDPVIAYLDCGTNELCIEDGLGISGAIARIKKSSSSSYYICEIHGPAGETHYISSDGLVPPRTQDVANATVSIATISGNSIYHGNNGTNNSNCYCYAKPESNRNCEEWQIIGALAATYLFIYGSYKFEPSPTHICYRKAYPISNSGDDHKEDVTNTGPGGRRRRRRTPANVPFKAVAWVLYIPAVLLLLIWLFIKADQFVYWDTGFIVLFTIAVYSKGPVFWPIRYVANVIGKGFCVLLELLISMILPALLGAACGFGALFIFDAITDWMEWTPPLDLPAAVSFVLNNLLPVSLVGGAVIGLLIAGVKQLRSRNEIKKLVNTFKFVFNTKV